MGKILKLHGGGIYLGGAELLLDSGEKILLTNSGSSGYKIKTIKLGFMLNTVWTCDNQNRLQKLVTPTLNKMTDEIEKKTIDPLLLVATSLINQYKSLREIQENL